MASTPLNVVMMAVECYPYVKVGGLADVVASLARELNRRGAAVDVVIPDFHVIDHARWGFEPFRLEPEAVRTDRLLPERIWRARPSGSAVEVFAIGGKGYFDREGIYVDPATREEYPDQLERWVFFQRAALAVIEALRPQADLIHYHDHHTGLVPLILDQGFRGEGALPQTATVGTIHNLAFQGIYDAERWPVLGLAGDFGAGHPLEYHGRINLMKAAILGGDALTTVSPTYAREIQTPEFGCGLDGCLRDRRDALTGILNGIDPEVWHPDKDPLIRVQYTAERIEGKALNRRMLLEELGFDPRLHKGPLIAMISRIDRQKGFDLLLPILDEVLSREVFFLLLGKGDREIERAAQEIIGRRRDRAAVRFEFDEGLAHRAEAGADIFLMPSLFEPCGLNQMYSLKYGAAPVVRATGGLADTVEEFDPVTGRGNGFVFRAAESAALMQAIERALRLWGDQASWKRMQRNGMEADFSWSRSAGDYLDVYRQAVARRGRDGGFTR